MNQTLTQAYNQDTDLNDLIKGDPQQSIMARVRRGEIPAIMSNDTRSSSDIWGFLMKSPSNAFNVFYNPRKVNVDDVGRLGEKALRGFYRPITSVVRWTSIFKPAKRDGIKNLIEMDLDSFSYMEPILHYSDAIAMKHLQPLYAGTETLSDHLNSASQGRNTTQNNQNGESLVAGIRCETAALKALAEKLRTQGLTPSEQAEYNRILTALFAHQLTASEKLEEMTKDINLALDEIDKLKIDTVKNKLKRERIKAMRQHFLRLQKQSLNLCQHLEHTRTKLSELSTGEGMRADQFAAKIKNIATDLDSKLDISQKTANDQIDMAHARSSRKIRIRDENGKIIGEENSKAEDHRRLKLGLDLLFVPETAQTLGVVTPTEKEHNAESYFYKIVEHGLNNAFNPETGDIIPIAQRGSKYGEDLAEYVARLYQLNLAEDALYAIKLLKMAEGKENQQMFPSGFKALVKKQMAGLYGIDDKAIEANPHAKHFLERAHDLCQDGHSPLTYGPRDTAKTYYTRVKSYIYGRMYPSSDGFIATPLHMELVQEPLLKRRAKVVAYWTGGDVVSLSDAGRAPTKGNVLEEELKLCIQRNWWWSAKEPEEENPDGTPPKPKNMLRRTYDFHKRSPFWAKMAVRSAQATAVAASIFMLTGGAALLAAPLPLYAAAPLYAVGAMGGLNYGLKFLKNLWRMPLINKSVKFTAKWAAITAVTAGALYLAAPAMPFVGAWAWGLAMAYPTTAAALASPFALLGGIALAQGVRRIVKGSADGNRKATFGDIRPEMGLDDDPMNILDENGQVKKPTAPNLPSPIVLDLTPPDLTAEVDPATGEPKASPSGDKQSQKQFEDFMEAFMKKMDARDERFFEEMKKAWNAQQEDEKEEPDPNAAPSGGGNTPNS